MTEPQPAEPGQTDDKGQALHRRADPPIVSLPKWVPIGLGLVLLIMAVLAVYTGLNYRNVSLSRGLGRVVSSRTPSRVAESGVPGEPQPGASRVVHGEHGEAIPQPDAFDPDQSPSAIRSEGGAVIPVIRLAARRGLLVRVIPDDALVYVNGQPIGAARQFSSSDQIYEFAEEGRFAVRLVAPGYHEVEYEISATQDAADEVAVINAKLRKE